MYSISWRFELKVPIWNTAKAITWKDMLYHLSTDPFHEDKDYEYNVFLPVVNNLNSSKFFNVTGNLGKLKNWIA